jgi:hypothetical protein
MKKILFLLTAVSLVSFTACSEDAEALYNQANTDTSSQNGTPSASGGTENGYTFRHKEFAQTVLDSLYKLDKAKAGVHEFVGQDKADYNVKTCPIDLAKRLDDEYDNIIKYLVSTVKIDHLKHSYSMQGATAQTHMASDSSSVKAVSVSEKKQIPESYKKESTGTPCDELDKKQKAVKKKSKGKSK